MLQIGCLNISSESNSKPCKWNDSCFQYNTIKYESILLYWKHNSFHLRVLALAGRGVRGCHPLDGFLAIVLEPFAIAT